MDGYWEWKNHVGNKFKKGDRVICVQGDPIVLRGWKGTVLEDSAIPRVDWDGVGSRIHYETCMELLCDNVKYEIEE